MYHFRLFGFSAALVLAAGVVATADQAAAQGAGADAAIVTNVQAQYAARGVTQKTQISITSAQGVVTLSGTARSLAAKDEAEDLARKVAGVKSVNDNVMIEPVPDPAIVMEIKSVFDTSGVSKAAHITVTSVQGAVTLTGTANSPAAKDEARDVARAARGVKSVDNKVVASQ